MDHEPNEKSAMLSRLSTAYNHGAVDIPDESVPRRGWIQSKFTQVYLLLFLVAILCIATFVLSLVVALRLKDLGDRYGDMAQDANTGMRSFSSLFSYPQSGSSSQQQPPGAGSQQQQQQQRFSQLSAPKAHTSNDGQNDNGGSRRSPLTREEDPPVAAEKPPRGGQYPPAPLTTTTTTTTEKPVQLPPGIDPSIFKPENLPLLLQLAKTYHIDLTKLPKEYQALVPTPINATVVRKEGEPSTPTEQLQRKAQKAPSMPPIPEQEEVRVPLEQDLSEEQDMLDEWPSSEKTEDVVVVKAVPELVKVTTTTPKQKEKNEGFQAFMKETTNKEEEPKKETVEAKEEVKESEKKTEETVETRKQEVNEDQWHDPTCGKLGKCTRDDIGDPPLLVISLDGFAHKYLSRKLTPTLEKLAECGATSEFVYPSYPSKTFPNHFTIATGMWPSVHGIVDNSIFDPSISPHLESLKKNLQNQTAFFKAEPIWSSYKRLTGKKTACLFWVGCQHNITEYVPDYNLPYDKEMSRKLRIELIMEWLKKPSAERPGLITAYFVQPDTAAHWQKSRDELNEVLVEVDAALNELMKALHKENLLECVNIVVVSDHGMHRLSKHIYFDEHFSLEGLVAASGVVGRLHWNGSEEHPSTVMADFRCSGGQEYRVYSPSSLPPRCHYASSRIVGDVIFEGQPGTTFYQSRSTDPKLVEDHGYDYILPAMRAVFFARGPSIKSKVILPPFQNVEYYHFFEDLLGIAEEKETNGTKGLLHKALVAPPKTVETKTTLLKECKRIREDAAIIACKGCSTANKRSLDSLMASLGDATTVNAQLAVEGDNSTQFCLQPFHDLVVAAPPDNNNGTRVVVESLSLTNTRSFGEVDPFCSFEHGRFENKCSPPSLPPGFALTSILASNQSGFSGLARARVPLHSSFVRGFFSPLQSSTREYLRKYGRLLSFTGTIFDYNTDGRADATVRSSIPSHIFRVLLSCRHWASDSMCSDPSDASVIAWIIPHVEDDFNCLPAEDLLLSYTARLKDVELATGLRFFADERIVGSEVARQIRSFIPDKLW